MKRPVAFLGALAAAWAPASGVAAEGADDRPSPKLVKVGWDCGPPQKLLDNLERVRTGPFDGWTIKLHLDHLNLFWKEPIAREVFEPYFASMRELAGADLGNATDNLVLVWSTGEAGWDWFDDDHWAAALSNLGLLAELAEIGGCDLFFDPESYPGLTHHYGEGAFWPFNYQDNPGAGERSYADYQRIVFDRGVEAMRLLQGIDPEIDLLSMYGLGVFSGLLDEPDPAKLTAGIEARTYYNLLPAFYAGMLSVAEPGFEVHDGNEPSYYYTTAGEFYEQRHRLLTRGNRLLPSRQRGEFAEHYRFANAVYGSEVYPADPENAKTYKLHFTAELSREEQAELLSHNTYYALHSTDRYVWVFTEGGMDFLTGDVPAGMVEAFERAKTLIRTGQPHPRGITRTVERARTAHEKRVYGDLRRGEAESVEAMSPLTLDGRADEPAWADAVAHPFFPSASAEERGLEPAPTTARFAADGGRLYVLVESEVADPDALVAAGSARDDAVWLGDDLEVVVGDPGRPGTFHQFIVNPAGVRYDAELTDSGDPTVPPAADAAGFDPDWNVGLRVVPASGGEPARWVAEFGLPWAALGGRPRNDQVLRLNVGRGSVQPGEAPFSAFSQFPVRFPEPAWFGVLKPGG